MAQKREKDETLELKVPAAEPSLSSLPSSCPDKNGKIPPGGGCAGPDLAWVDKKAERRPRSEMVTEAAEPPTKEEDSGEVEIAAAVAPAASLKRKAVNRCSGCGKRVGLTGFWCRCGDLFCSEHRYSDRHDCSYDYKAAGREAIARENPVVRAAKILKV